MALSLPFFTLSSFFLGALALMLRGPIRWGYVDDADDDAAAADDDGDWGLGLCVCTRLIRGSPVLPIVGTKGGPPSFLKASR